MVSVPNARTPHAGSCGNVSGTNPTSVRFPSIRNRTRAPGLARTERGMPSPAGKASVSVGVKLVVSIHAIAPGGGRNGRAMRATNVVSRCSAPVLDRATMWKCASESLGKGIQASQVPVAETRTGNPLIDSATSPLPWPTLPNRKDESCA